MANTYTTLPSLFTAIADSIRSKTGGTDPIVADTFPSAIDSIPAGGGDAESVLNSVIERTVTDLNSNATKLGDKVFYYFVTLKTVNFPVATTIGVNAFDECSNLTDISFPMVTEIGQLAFHNCRALVNVYMPNVRIIGTSAFNFCTSLTSVRFPAATTLRDSAFSYASALETADFPALTSIGKFAIQQSKLKTLILRSTTLCTLAATSAFNGTPIADGTGYIYVPSALVSEYQAATNWSTYSAQFRALEDYTVDGTISGELDPSKI